MPIVSPQEPAWERRRLRAPREDGEVLAIPPLAEMPATILQNRCLIDSWNVQVLGKPLRELRRVAREEVLTAAARFTAQLDQRVAGQEDSSLVRVSFDKPLIVGGHQPELFHPGVWTKNFVLDQMAKETGGIGLHLIVDNDTVPSTRLAVPVGSREFPRIKYVSFDADVNSLPWEEAVLGDETLFRTFADRVASALKCWPIKPMLSEIWPAAIRRLSKDGAPPRPRLSDLLTAVRHEAERPFGLNNLELPISQLCNTESFARFVCSLMCDPERTHSVYNEIAAEYRRINRVRNSQHPVPDLSTRAISDGNWFESPFWIWRSGDARRGRLFLRVTESELQLANAETVIASLPRIDADSVNSALAQLRALSKLGWKIRPRALTTTLFARVFFADAFLHGIGGAKYDEMTDRLIMRLFGVPAPSYLTVTATHHLPLESWKVTHSDVAALKHRLWDFDHNPERYLLSDAIASVLPPSESGRRPDERTAEVKLPIPTTQEANQHDRMTSSTSNVNSSPHASRLPAGERTEGSISEVTELLAEKRRLIAEQHAQDAFDRNDSRRASHAENNQRRRRLRELSQQIARLAHETRCALAAELEAAESHLAANAILQSREFSFCLFPADHFLPGGPTRETE